MGTLKRWAFEQGYSRYRRLTAPVGRAPALRDRSARGVNIGCGRNVLEGWLNVDLHPRPGAYRVDVTRPWPFPDGLFEAALCEHMIEHVPKRSALFVIAESFRTLKPGGWARFITPDPTTFAAKLSPQASQPARADADDVYLDFLSRFPDAASGFSPERPPDWCDALNNLFYNYGHRHLWSPRALEAALREAGFADLVETRAASPRQPVFAGVEGHPGMIRRETGMDGERLDAIEAFAIEARRPLR